MSTQQLTREEIARVFAMHIGQTIAHIEHISNETAELVGVIFNDAHFIHDGTGSYGHCSVIDAGKLLLTPRDRISDEHAEILYHQYCGQIAKYDYTQDYKGTTKAAMDWVMRGGIDEIGKYSCLTDLARSLGYDTPIYFKANHWANGKTAIELGIAIDNLQTK